MADQTYRACYASKQNLSTFTSIAKSGAGYSTITGFEPERAFDNRRSTYWTVPDSTAGDFGLELTWSSAFTFTNATAVGIANHNLATAGIVGIKHDYWNGSTWLHAATVAVLGYVNDGQDIFWTYNAGVNGYTKHRFTFNTIGGGGPSADCNLGQLFLGESIALADPVVGVVTDQRFPAVISQTEAGEIVVQAMASRHSEIRVPFNTIDSDELDDLLDILDQCNGPAYPFLLYTHRQNDWSTSSLGTSGNFTLTGKGSAYFMNLASDRIEHSEIYGGVYDAVLELRRSMDADAI